MMNKYIVLCASTALIISCGEGSIGGDLTDRLQQNESKNMSEFAGRAVVFYNVENLFDTKNDPRTDDEDFTPSGDNRWDEERYHT